MEDEYPVTLLGVPDHFTVACGTCFNSIITETPTALLLYIDWVITVSFVCKSLSTHIMRGKETVLLIHSILIC